MPGINSRILTPFPTPGVHVGRDVELRSGDWRAVVSPLRGGRLRWLGEAGAGERAPWLRPMQMERGVMHGGGAMQLLQPADLAEELLATMPDPGAVDESWQLTGQSPDAVSLMLHARGESPGSWSFQASQTLALQEGRLDWTLSVRNLSRAPMPARLGWQLHFPDDFAEIVCVDDALSTLRHAPRGHAERREAWCGLATLGRSDGRFLLLRAAPPVTALLFERHPARASLHLDLTTPDTPRAEPLPRGEELTLRLTIDLMQTLAPPLSALSPAAGPGPVLL